MKPDELKRIRQLQKLALDAAIDLATVHIDRRLIFVVVAVDVDEAGLSAYATGVGHPPDLPVEPSLILRAALSSIGADLSDPADRPS